MDTILHQSEKKFKLAINLFNAAITMVLCLCFPVTIFANENALIANSVAPIINAAKIEKSIQNVINTEEETKNFNESVKKRYKNAVVKDVTLGVKHIRLVRTYNGRPVRINVVEINRKLNPNLNISPVLSSEFKLNSRSGISRIAQKNNSLVAINGTFFKPQTGVPLGTLMINGEIQTGPIYDRVALGIFDNYYDTARVQLNANLITKSSKIKIDNINQPRMLSTYTLMYTPIWGEKSAPTPKYGIQIGVSGNRVIEVSQTQIVIPKDGFVISGPAGKLGGLKVGDIVKAEVMTIPEWENVKHIISGGPYLLKMGDVFIDVKEEKLPSITGRNPRTAVGYTPDNNLVLVTVDGREQASIGMSLRELALFMKSIGCYEAINLDGGGSSVLYVNGHVVNHPAQKGGIALSNALTVSLQ